MSSAVVAPAPVAASPKAKKGKSAGKAKGASKPKTHASHPTYGDMIHKAIKDLNDKKGSSRSAVLKYIASHYKLGDNIIKINAHLRQALKRGVTSGALKQSKGTGASGSFRIGEKSASGKVKKVRKPKSAKAKTAKPAAAAVAGGAPAAAKPKKAKSPKKAKKAASPKKPKAAKPKKAKSPKKAKAAKPKKAKSPKKAKAAKPKKAAAKK